LGSNISIFTLYSLGKVTSYPHDVALETALVNNITHYAKSRPDNADFLSKVSDQL